MSFEEQDDAPVPSLCHGVLWVTWQVTPKMQLGMMKLGDPELVLLKPPPGVEGWSRERQCLKFYGGFSFLFPQSEARDGPLITGGLRLLQPLPQPRGWSRLIIGLTRALLIGG